MYDWVPPSSPCSARTQSVCARPLPPLMRTSFPMGGAELPAPLAEGNLRRTPFAHVLLYVLQRGLSGTLVVWRPADSEPNSQDRVRFERGHPVAGRLLRRSSTLDRGLLPLFRCDDAPYAFYQADLVGTDTAVVTGQIDSLKLIAASLRGAARDDAVEEVLKRFGEGSVRIRAGAEIERFGFDAKETGFVNYVLAAPGSIPALVDGSGNPRVARRLLYLLAITKTLEPFEPTSSGVEAASEQPVAAARLSGPPRATPGSGPRIRADSISQLAEGPQSSVPPRRSSYPARPRSISEPRVRQSLSPRSKPPSDYPPDPPLELDDMQLARWEEIRRKVKAVEGQNYFEMLGIKRNASGAEAQNAYFSLVKKWHPDRLPEELEELRPYVDRVFYYLTQAKDVLTNDSERQEHARIVDQGGGTPESDRRVNEIVQAALEFQKAEVLFRRRDYTGALEIVEGAKEMNPEESDYHAFEGWLLFHMYGPQDAPYERMLEATAHALKLRPTNDKAHFYRGMILKRRGEPVEAMVHFKKAADLNPRNVDAVREVRLATMRRKGGSMRPGARSSLPPPSSSGFLSKFFGNGKKK